MNYNSAMTRVSVIESKNEWFRSLMISVNIPLYIILYDLNNMISRNRYLKVKCIYHFQTAVELFGYSNLE